VTCAYLLSHSQPWVEQSLFLAAIGEARDKADVLVSTRTGLHARLVRIAFGALAAVRTLSLLPDLYQFFGNDGVAPHKPLDPYRWSVFEIWTSDGALLIGCAVLLVSAVALTIGWHRRIAAVLVFVPIL
jgi:hypothetical protein